jgi:toxin-antitoxin system PIN domain toxin
VRALLDINVLIALLDPDHAFHHRAHHWWNGQSNIGWASCPLTENGIVRIMSNPGYSKSVKFQPKDLIQQLDRFVNQSNHEFWPDDLSLRDRTAFFWDRFYSPRAITDAYLLALAVKHHGTLATFDQAIPVTTVLGTATANLSRI